MSGDEHEWLFRHGDYAIRYVTDEELEAERLSSWEYYAIVVHIPTGERLGEDGIEPEDQILVRDWNWIPHALDAAEKRGREAAAKDAAELERLRDENERLRLLAKDMTLDACDRAGGKVAKLLAVAEAAEELGSLAAEVTDPADLAALGRIRDALDALEQR